RIEILDKEKGERSQRLDTLGKKREEYAERLRTKQANQRALERQGVSKDASMRGLLQSFAQMQLGWYEKELVQTESDFRRAKVELATQQEVMKSLATAGVPDAEIQQKINEVDAVQKAEFQITAFKA